MTSNLRIGGLASGIDTDSIIKDLMQAHRIPVQKLEQDKQILEWQQEDYREINTSLRTFRDTVFNMKLQSTYLAKNASSSNESVLTATAASTAAPGSYTVTVTKLAKGVSVASTGELADETSDSGTLKKLAEQFTGLPATLTFSLTGSQGSKDFSFDTASKTIYDVVAEINDADLGITASYDGTLNRFFLNTTTTGTDAVINVTADPDKFLSGDGTGNDNTLKLKLVTGNNTGQDASFDFGDAAGLTSSTNNVTVNGVNLTLKAGGTATVTVSKNTDAVFDAIVDFIDKYNTTMETISDKLYEERYSDYKPLTDEQREQLTDDQIDQWIEKARSGLLRHDPTLSSIFSNMRMTMSATVDVGGGYVKDGQTVYSNSLAAIGITTTQDYMSGTLVIDETKLREAVEQDPQGVLDLFTKSADDYSQKGIAMRLYDDVNNAMDRIIEKAGSDTNYDLVDDSFIGEEIKDIDERIETMEERLQQIEDRYWRQFTAMEKAIQQMNAQSMWLMQQFGTGGQ
ncbi:flagellar hook-associated protein 2 [Desulfoscipio geothermicus]|uniref:Flagellar hook-associated protein 2 n=1 Tax=Desulfoscipio geothermicus DSM 3669 TaxID=1121426 RepID=A0A1I6CV29_9FIRM|nr:flagellar hook-associated protein 2 [Desulfoscipio geothermicus]SFQ96977.1 flagellar hook-associated protein 2 [Desulfoscipio geothermicus DSM 3669]